MSEAHLQPIRFQGQSFDVETGLHYNRFRYFDPDLGMFTTRDPIGLMGGTNVFQYAPNPTGWIDPFGLAVTPLDKTGFTTYGLYRPGESTPYYVGHTEQTMQERLSQHKTKTYSSQGGATRADSTTSIRSLKGGEGSLTYSESKGYEQAYREKYNTKGFPGNIIEPIDKSRTDPRGQSHYDNYETAAKEAGVKPTRDKC